MSILHRASSLWLLLLIVLLGGFDPFRTSNSEVEEGNRLLAGGKPKEALSSYDKAAKQLPDEPGVQYNRGIALHDLGDFEKARQALMQATQSQDPSLRARAFHNLGNAHFQLKQYKEAAEAYKRTLRLRPDSLAAKWNLELALRRQQEEQKKKDQQKKDQDKKDQDKKDQDKKDPQKDQQQKDSQKKDPQKKDPQKPDEQKQDQQKKDQQKKDQQKDPEKDKPKPEQPPEPQDGQKGQRPPTQDQQQMDSVLDALDQDNKKLQRNRARMQAPGNYRPSKDW